ncbi:MAG: putative regulatory protein [Bacteroidota bacterium]|nr:putative regulatory protein [Bacteroidota bacterium]
MCKMLGYDTTELKDAKFETLLDMAGKIFFQTHFFPLLKIKKNVDEIFLHLKSKNSELVPVITSAVREETVNDSRCVCVFLPVPNRKKFEQEILRAKNQAEEALKQNKELIETREEANRHSKELDRKVNELNQKNHEILQFNTIINHEMQECVRKILLFSRLGQQDENTDQYEKIIRSASRLKSINSALNLFISLDKGHTDTRLVNLNQCMEQAKNEVVENTQFTGLELISDTLPEVEGIAEDLKLLFYHLISNAVKFRKDDHVSLRISCTIYRDNIYKETAVKYEYHDVVRIVLSDDGQGFDSTHKEYVFSIFKKLNHDVLGSGIGLAICKKIVDNHGGTISIDSTENVGTTVKVVLPFKYHV